MIPFSPPRIDDEICNAVVETLKSGWITTGPKTKEFERRLTAYCGCKSTLCLNSATAGLEIMLRWFGVGRGDEVILPAYTYAATANVIVHCGARPVFVDVNEHDFNISVNAVRQAITARTKVIMAVDFAGMPCDYFGLKDLALAHQHLFLPENAVQKMLGRVLLLADAAHSLGARSGELMSGALADASAFSFHAVKNLTTAEGGSVALNLPPPFDNQAVYDELAIKSLHGQNKDALAKTQKGNWRYDIVEAGYKCNMTDIAATMGLVELARYENDTLPRRRAIANSYDNALAGDQRFILPLLKDKERVSSYHLYPLRLKNATEAQRDEMIRLIFESGVSVNVHFLPVPATSFYRSLGYDMDHYPVALSNYSREITLPVYYDLTDDNIATIVSAVRSAADKVLGAK